MALFAVPAHTRSIVSGWDERCRSDGVLGFTINAAFF